MAVLVWKYQHGPNRFSRNFSPPCLLRKSPSPRARSSPTSPNSCSRPPKCPTRKLKLENRSDCRFAQEMISTYHAPLAKRPSRDPRLRGIFPAAFLLVALAGTGITRNRRSAGRGRYAAKATFRRIELLRRRPRRLALFQRPNMTRKQKPIRTIASTANLANSAERPSVSIARFFFPPAVLRVTLRRGAPLPPSIFLPETLSGMFRSVPSLPASTPALSVPWRTDGHRRRTRFHQRHNG